MKAIVAMAENRVIGNGGAIPWHLPEDFKFFKATTLGHAVVMGRKTHESIGKPLPGRENIVLSRTLPESSGIRVVHSLEELLKLDHTENFFVIGGAEIYKLLLPYCNELFVTLIPRSIKGDTFFPRFEEDFGAGVEIFETPDFTTFLYRRTR